MSEGQAYRAFSDTKPERDREANLYTQRDYMILLFQKFPNRCKYPMSEEKAAPVYI